MLCGRHISGKREIAERNSGQRRKIEEGDGGEGSLSC